MNIFFLQVDYESMISQFSTRMIVYETLADSERYL